MFLKKIEIQGFKSFANKTELHFNKNLTAIVGPNGSGKSNIADAIRWATGEQSQKTLRTKKSDEVIFAGSDKKNRLGMAEVSLYLDNSDKKADLDYDEIVITRKVYRTGENEYIINNNKVRLLDVQLLLTRAMVGQGNYSIIGQGMIDSILSQSGVTRKNFFDEATGVREYQIKKDRAQSKYISTQENLNQSKIVLNEIAPRLKYLTKQVTRLSKQQELKNELELLQSDYYGFLLSEIDKKILETKNELDKKIEEKNKIQKESDSIQEKINKEENRSSYSKDFNSLQKEYEELVNSKNKLLHDKVLYQGKLDVEFSQSGKNNLSWFLNQKNEFENELKTNTTELSLLKENLTGVEKDLIEKLEKQEEFLKKINSIQEKLEENFAESSNSQIDSSELKDKIKKLHEKIQNIINEIDTIDKEKLKQEIYFLSKEIEYLHKNINKDSSQGTTREEYQKIQNEFQRYITSKDSLVNEIFELKNQKSLFDSKINSLEKRQSDMKSSLDKVNIEIEMANSSDRSKTEDKIEGMIIGIDKEIKILEDKIKEVKNKIESLDEENEKNRKNLFELQKNLRNIQSEIDLINSDIQEININLAKLQTKQEDIKNEIFQENVNEEKLNYESSIDQYESQEKIQRLKKLLSQIGEIEENIENEFSEVETKYKFLDKQIIDLDNASKNLKEIIDDLNIKIEEKFYTNFNKINEAFNKYFRILFDGGSANLTIKKDDENETPQNNNEQIEGELETQEESESKTYEGKMQSIMDISISIKILGKKLTSVNYLSGGEKALTSIALICAIIYNNPSPFVVLDEVDAALDEANSERFAEIIDNLKDKTQFICVTHNRATMHKAETLYGVTMDDNGISKILSISFNEAKKYSEN